MNLKDQVLSIEQVQELTELGFDVKKYASVTVIKTNSDECYIMPLNYLEQYDAFEYDVVDEKYYSLTIVDIIKVLPKMIGVYSIEFDFIGNQVYIDYIYRRESLPKLDHIFDMDNKESVTLNLTNALFETLKWCIKNKHITI